MPQRVSGKNVRDIRLCVEPRVYDDLEFLLGRLPHGSFFCLPASEYLVGFLVNERSEITSMMEYEAFRAGFNHQEGCSGSGIPVKGQKRWGI